jgi:DNA helicase II / ATP-dependent DNA helicase PcrA
MHTDNLNSHLETLNSVQKEAVFHQGCPLLILAGAGSGKTRVITVKIAYLIDRAKEDPHSLLAVTFTNKAAREMRSRAVEMCPRAADVMIRTFHSFGAWLVRRNASRLGLPPGFSIYDDDDVISLLRSVYPDRSRSDLAREARRISRAKDYGLGPGDDLSMVTRDPEFAGLYAEYQKKLREVGNVDFGDLILLPILLFREHPEIRDRMRDRFRTVLVDEYQDSNVAQYLLLRELVDPQTYICVVGDDDQSIYRFRGAEVRNILTFPESFPGTETVRLEENYRSTGSILDLASAVVSHNTGRLGKTLFTARETGARPRLAILSDQDEEAAFCAQLIRSRPELTGETAILYRTNAQSRVFETTFLREGIPFRVVGTLRFYEREEIKDALAFLRFLANPRDEVSFRRIINKPSRGLGPSRVGVILRCSYETGGNLEDAARAACGEITGKARDALAAFLKTLDTIRRSGTGKTGITKASENETTGAGTLASLVDTMLAESGLRAYHAEQDEISGNRKVENLEELINAASLYPPGETGLVEFLESLQLDAAREAENGQDAGPAVTLITMHNTKGLEFDRVIITGLEEGVFPRSDDSDPDDLEEERRLFYVAVTRARHELYLTSCRSRRVHGRVLFCNPSRFLQEIPRELVTVEGEEDGVSPFASKTYRPGVWVYHDEYGPGVVEKNWYNGKNEIVFVRFESGRVAQFLTEFAALEVIAPDE